METRKPTIADAMLESEKEKETIKAIKELLDGLTVESVERILANIQLATSRAIFHADNSRQ